MIVRKGRRYVRKDLPHTEVTVLARSGGQVTYLMHIRRSCELTISIRSFKMIYRKV